MKTPLITRLAALAASAAITFSIVVLLSDYALPPDSGVQLLAEQAITKTQ